MIYISGLVGFLLVLTAEARVGNSTESPLCTETQQCLLFDLICETDNYEVRHYDSVKWVSTDETSLFMGMAAMRAFNRLFKYITGANKDGKKIEMTAPVIMKIAEKKFWQTGQYTMSFLLPYEDQMTPSQPDNAEVYIHEMSDVKMYVKSYGGFMTSLSDKRHADDLANLLTSSGAKFKKDFHYAVGYNSPWTMFNRHNEVWFIAEGEPVCSSSEEMDD